MIVREAAFGGETRSMDGEKPVFLNGKEIGSARSWAGVAKILRTTLDHFEREILAGSVERFEGPDGFHVTLKRK